MTRRERPRAVSPFTDPEVYMSRSAAVLAVLLLLLASSCESAPRNEEGAPASAADTAAAGVDSVATPAVRDTGDSVASAPPDSARKVTYYVHLRDGVDPRALARRHELVPSEVITDPRPGFIVGLTEDERAALEADSLVRSLARQIHGDDEEQPPIRTLGGDTTGG